MATLAVEQTIGDSYRFVFRNILSIFGIAWLPTVIIAAAIAGAFWTLAPDFQSLDWSAHPDLAHNREVAMSIVWKVWSLLLPIEILFYLLVAMIVVGIQRKALDRHEGPVYIFFSLGGEVWRLLGALIFAFLLIALNGALTFAAAALVFAAGQYYNLPGIYGLIEFVAVIAGICWICYFAVRLTFFIAPAVVAEGGFGIGRSWTLGRGNFWRIIVVFLACVVGPMIVISMASEAVIWPFMMAPMLRVQQVAEAHQVLPPDQAFALFSSAFRQILPLWAGIQLVTFPVAMGLSNAMSAFAYKHLTAPEAAA